MSDDALSRDLVRVRKLMRARLGVKGRSLGAQIALAGRYLPRRLRVHAQVMAQAEAMQGHPHLRMMIPADETRRAGKELQDGLRSIHGADRRIGVLLARLAVIAFNLLVIAGLFLVALRWRGMV